MNQLSTIDFARHRCELCREQGPPEYVKEWTLPDPVGGTISGDWVHRVGGGRFQLCAASSLWELERVNGQVEAKK